MESTVTGNNLSNISPFAKFMAQAPSLKAAVANQTQLPLVDQLIYPGDIVTIQAAPGGGATTFALALTLGMTRTNDIFNRFHCPKPIEVIYFEGSMALAKLMEQIQVMNSGVPQSNFMLVSRDSAPDDLRIDLAQADFQHKFLNWLDQNKLQDGVVVFDSSVSLIQSELKKDTAHDLGQFMLALRQEGMTQIWIAPQTKKAAELPENLVDLTLQLTSIEDPQTLVLRIDFVKARNLDKKQRQPFLVELTDTGDGKRTIVDREFIANKKHQALSLYLEGKTQEEIGDIVGKDQSTICRWIQGALQDYLISKNGHRNYEVTAIGQKVLGNSKMQKDA